MGYSAYQIADFLDNYALVYSGDFSNTKNLDDPTTRHSIPRSPFETPIIFKADIDFAIDKLGRKGAWLKWSRNIWKNPENLNHKQRDLAGYIMGEGVYIHTLVRELSKILNEGDLI